MRTCLGWNFSPCLSAADQARESRDSGGVRCIRRKTCRIRRCLSKDARPLAEEYSAPFRAFSLPSCSVSARRLLGSPMGMKRKRWSGPWPPRWRYCWMLFRRRRRRAQLHLNWFGSKNSSRAISPSCAAAWNTWLSGKNRWSCTSNRRPRFRRGRSPYCLAPRSLPRRHRLCRHPQCPTHRLLGDNRWPCGEYWRFGRADVRDLQRASHRLLDVRFGPEADLRTAAKDTRAVRASIRSPVPRGRSLGTPR